MWGSHRPALPPVLQKVVEMLRKVPFVRDLNDTALDFFISVKTNSSLTQGQKLSTINNWKNGLGAQAQADYAKMQAEVMKMKMEAVDRIRNHTTNNDVIAFINASQAIFEKQDINMTESCHEFIALLKSTSNATLEALKEAAKSAGFNPKGGMEGMMNVGDEGLEGKQGMGGGAEAGWGHAGMSAGMNESVHEGGGFPPAGFHPPGMAPMNGTSRPHDFCVMMASAAEHIGHLIEFELDREEHHEGGHHEEGEHHEGPHGQTTTTAAAASR